VPVAGNRGSDETQVLMWDCYDSHTGQLPDNNVWSWMGDVSATESTIHPRDYGEPANSTRCAREHPSPSESLL
jgi:hypothetical protein